MNIRTRFFRKPVLTALWLAVLMLMSLLLSVGGGLWYSSANLPRVLDSHHTTIAVQTQKETWTERNTKRLSITSFSNEQRDLLSGMDEVELLDFRTLTAAYIPELRVLVGSKDWYGMNAIEPYEFANESYQQMVLVGTVKQSWFDYADQFYTTDLTALGGKAGITEIDMCATLEVEQVISGHEGFPIFPSDQYSSYSGTVMVRIPVYDEGSGENYFQPGQRYLVRGEYHYGSTYVSVQPPIPDEERGVMPTIIFINPSANMRCLWRNNQVYTYTSCNSVWSTDADGKDYVKITAAKDPVPVAVLLEGDPENSLETLLADSSNGLAAILEDNERALHSFPVLGTQCLESMYGFVKNEVSLVEGRTFTREDYDTGAKVCVISQSLALTAGIGVGDTITLSQYRLSGLMLDDSFNNSLRADMPTKNNPRLGTQPLPEHYDTQDEAFTVVGLYRQENEWRDDQFSFTPNTIFVPQKAQLPNGYGGGFSTGAHGVYFSIKLKNGAMEDFKEALVGTSLESRDFATFDQGYAAAMESVNAVGESARKLLLVALAGWALLLALYMLLYQGAQRKNLGTMRALGAKTNQVRRYLAGSGSLLAVLGVSAGAAASGYVMALVQDKLLGFTMNQMTIGANSGGMALTQDDLSLMLTESAMPTALLIALVLGQIILIAGLLWIQAAALAKKNPRNLMGV